MHYLIMKLVKLEYNSYSNVLSHLIFHINPTISFIWSESESINPTVYTMISHSHHHLIVQVQDFHIYMISVIKIFVFIFVFSANDISNPRHDFDEFMWRI